SFYLRDEPDPDRPGKVRVVRSDYLEFRLAPSNNAKEPPATVSPPAPEEPGPRAGGTPGGDQRALAATLKSGGAQVDVQGDRVVGVLLGRTTEIGPLLPLLQKLPDLEELAIHSPKMDDAGMAALKGLPKLALLNLTLSSVGDDGLRVIGTLPRLR